MWVSNLIKVKMSYCKNQGKRPAKHFHIHQSRQHFTSQNLKGHHHARRTTVQCNIWSSFDLHGKNVFAAVSCTFRDIVSLKFVRKKLPTWQFTIRVIRDPFLDPLSWPQDTSALKRLYAIIPLDNWKTEAWYTNSVCKLQYWLTYMA
jgi:hypothetical protein